MINNNTLSDVEHGLKGLMTIFSGYAQLEKDERRKRLFITCRDTVHALLDDVVKAINNSNNHGKKETQGSQC